MPNCIFCRIVRGDIPSKNVFEDEKTLAFMDIQPKAPGHTLLIPKAHYQWFEEVPDEISDVLFRNAKQLAKDMKERGDGDYVHVSIVGTDVPHTHLHLIPRKLQEKQPEV
jgi:histidine triad (HIT) family protein